MLKVKIKSSTSAAGGVSSTTHTQRNEVNAVDVTCGMRRLSPIRFIHRPSPSKQKLQRVQGSTPTSPQPEPIRQPSPTKLVLSRMRPPKMRRMSAPKFRNPIPPNLRKLTFAVPSAFSWTKHPIPLLLCVPVKDTYNNLDDTDGKDAASLDPSALVSLRTPSTVMTNPVSNKVPQQRNIKAEAKEGQHQQEPRKEHNNSSSPTPPLRLKGGITNRLG